MKLDEVNLAIIRHLHDGRKSYKKISEDLNITENTVRARVNKLTEEGILQISGFVDPERLPGHHTVIVGVNLNNMGLVKKGEEFTTLRGVVSVSVVTGRFDLILVVNLKDEFGLLEFYSEEISKMDNVRSVETFVVYKGYNLRVPYIL